MSKVPDFEKRKFNIANNSTIIIHKPLCHALKFVQFAPQELEMMACCVVL